MIDQLLTHLKHSRPLQIGIGCALTYILLTWGLYLNWYGDLETFMDGVGSGIPADDPNRIQRIVESTSNAPQWPFLLKALSYPIPGPATVEYGGAMPFWSVLVQGAWLGAAVWSAFNQTTGRLVVLCAVPFVVLYLISGSLVASLMLGFIGSVIVSGIGLLVGRITGPAR